MEERRAKLRLRLRMEILDRQISKINKNREEYENIHKNANLDDTEIQTAIATQMCAFDYAVKYLKGQKQSYLKMLQSFK